VDLYNSKVPKLDGLKKLVKTGSNKKDNAPEKTETNI
jgi:hypothetical protein